MYTRKTSDYSPTFPGSGEEKRAIAARREMLGWFAARTTKPFPKRLTWAQRMSRRAAGFKPR